MPESPGVSLPGDLAQGLCQLAHGDVDIHAFMDRSEQQQQCTTTTTTTTTHRFIRHHTFGCPLAAGVLGSLPACAQGSSVLGPGSGDSSVRELVYLGLLVVLFCGLLIGLARLARLAFCRTGFGGSFSPLSAILPFG